MQTLGLSDSTPRSEGRLKALLWPTIRNEGDFDYITEQGFWVCFIVATVTLLYSVFTRSLVLGIFESLFYFLAAVGVRQRSNGAAIAALTAYVLGAFVILKYTGQGFGIVRIVFIALLTSNLRGAWLSSRWKRLMPEEAPVRLNQTVFDKLSDQLPPKIWPKAKWIFAVIAVLEIALMLYLLIAPIPPMHLA